MPRCRGSRVVYIAGFHHGFFIFAIVLTAFSIVPSRGVEVAPASLLEVLYPYQRAGSVNLARAFALEGVSV